MHQLESNSIKKNTPTSAKHACFHFHIQMNKNSTYIQNSFVIETKKK